jgi:hypothetical protein
VVTRAGAVRAGFHDGGQAGLAHDPQGLAAGIHRCGCFQGSAGALAGEAAAPGIWRMHNRAGRRPGSSGSGADRATGRLRVCGSAHRSMRAIVSGAVSPGQLVFRLIAAVDGRCRSHHDCDCHRAGGDP